MTDEKQLVHETANARGWSSYIIYAASAVALITAIRYGFGGGFTGNSSWWDVLIWAIFCSWLLEGELWGRQAQEKRSPTARKWSAYGLYFMSGLMFLAFVMTSDTGGKWWEAVGRISVSLGFLVKARRITLAPAPATPNS